MQPFSVMLEEENTMNQYTPPESILPLLEKHPAIFRFRRALRRADQVALDHILALACGSAPESGPNSYPLVEHILLIMILAEQKELGQMARALERALAAEILPAAGLTCHSSAPSVPPAA